MAKSLNGADIAVVRPSGVVSPNDRSKGPFDDNNSNDPTVWDPWDDSDPVSDD